MTTNNESSAVLIRSTPRAPKGSAEDLTGLRFGNLAVLYPLNPEDRMTTALWRCRCDCGNEVDVSYHALTRGNDKSCGCLKRQYQVMLHDRLHLVDGTCVEWLAGRKSRVDNSSGFRGVFKKKSGKYMASIGFKKKIYYLGTFESYEDAVEQRLKWERLIHDGFVKARSEWVSMAEHDSEWARKNPFIFDVAKDEQGLRIINSMEHFGKGGGETAPISE